ncbi:MAG: right-handed parallel beta-helix repeat-containing protein [Candidatus Hodarchaeales archaeon]|jgi:parallel beta-helix repeat protein
MIPNRTIYSLEAILLILCFFGGIFPLASLNQDREHTQRNVLFAGLGEENVRKTAQRQQSAAQSLELKVLKAISPKRTTLQTYAPHAPISIFSDNEFVSLRFPGSGTFDDPYRIEGFNITNATRPLIEIRNTTAYFRISMNLLNGLNTATRGIYFDNVTHGAIENNLIASSREGILLKKSHYNTIRYNNVSFSDGYGVRLDGFVDMGTSSNNNLVKWNGFIGNQRRWVAGQSAISQAYNGGTGNTFAYNYWDDWTQPDADGDGIVDEPYQIMSPYGLVSGDRSPLSSPTHFADSDGDGIDDGYEVELGLDPLVNDSYEDLDGDGMPNLWELQMGLNPANPWDAAYDSDNDDLTNLQEYQLGLNAIHFDTDSDGMPDGWEVEMSLDAANSRDAAQDADADGLSNLQEYKADTDPNDPDSDNDFFPDGLDHSWWGNPRANWDNLFVRLVLIGFLFVFIAWIGFIIAQRPKLQEGLRQELQQLQQQVHQLQESTAVIWNVESPQQLGEVSKNAYQLFMNCKQSIQAVRCYVARRWLPRFLRPDLTPIETIASSVNQIYTQFTQEYLRRVEDIIYE